MKETADNTADQKSVSESSTFDGVEKSPEKLAAKDLNLIDWAIDDPERPLNWSNTKKWRNLGIISFFRLLTPLASSMVAPATNTVLEDFGSTNRTIGSFIVSIYILGYALGPLVVAPMSEIYGRLPVYHVNSMLFCLWNLCSALAPNIGSLLAFRLLAGLAGSCPVTIGNGSIADCVRKEKRGTVMAMFSKFIQR